ncbi:MAG: thioredoxin [Nitrosopumilaceae archaeon]
MASENRKESEVKEVTAENWEKEVVSVQTPVIVDFWAPWCGPCKMIGPTIDEIARDQKFPIKFVKVNVDDNPSVAAAYNIQSIPTLAVFNNGRIVQTTIGIQSKSSLEKFIANTISKI